MVMRKLGDSTMTCHGEQSGVVNPSLSFAGSIKMATIQFRLCFFLLIISLVAGVVAFQRQDVFTDAVNKALGVATLEFALHSHGYLIVHVVG